MQELGELDEGNQENDGGIDMDMFMWGEVWVAGCFSNCFGSIGTMLSYDAISSCIFESAGNSR